MLFGPSMSKFIDDEVVVNELEESDPVESEKLDNSNYGSEKGNEKEKKVVLKTIPRTPPLFPQ